VLRNLPELSVRKDIIVATSNGLSRRTFVRRVAGAAWASTLIETGREPVLAEALANLRADATPVNTADEAFWDDIRARFLLEPDLIYLNAGTTGAMPRAILEAEGRYQRLLAENPKIRQHFEYEVVPTIVRKKAADLIGASLEETALTHNTSSSQTRSTPAIWSRGGFEPRETAWN
jgi:hypothetical protein